jgi:HD-like signal output (HDOD) protein
VADERVLLVLTCKCNQKMKVPAEAMGKSFKCVKCGAPIQVTPTNTSPMKPAAPAPATRTGQADAPQKGPRIGELLVAKKLITEEQLEEALVEQRGTGGKTFEILVRLGHLDKDGLHAFLSKQSGLPAIELKRMHIDSDLVELIPRDFALAELVLPIDRMGKLLTVAMACPLDTSTITNIESTTGLKVKAMLCRLDDIHDAVKRYYRSDDDNDEIDFASFGMTDEGPKEEVAGSISELTGLMLSTDVLKFLEQLQQGEDATVKDVSRIVATDPCLAAILLRAVNSPAYGMPGQIDNVMMAVALLGKDGVAGVAKNFRVGEATSPALSHFAAHGHRCAIAAAALAGNREDTNQGSAYTAGLLIQLGRIVLTTVSPDKYQRIESRLSGQALVDAEKRLFSWGHPEAGACLAALWRFPQSLEHSIRYYLSPEEAGENRGLASVLAVANVVSGLEPDAEDAALESCKDALDYLEMSTAEALQLRSQLPAT